MHSIAWATPRTASSSRRACIARARGPVAHPRRNSNRSPTARIPHSSPVSRSSWAPTDRANRTSPTPSFGCSESRAPSSSAARPWRTSSSRLLGPQARGRRRGHARARQWTTCFVVDFDEVAVTRRMYRSGESEYLMELQPVPPYGHPEDILHDSGLVGTPIRSSPRASSTRSCRAGPGRGQPDRGGRRNLQAQAPQGARPAQDQEHGRAPHTRPRHQSRDRANSSRLSARSIAPASTRTSTRATELTRILAVDESAAPGAMGRPGVLIT